MARRNWKIVSLITIPLVTSRAVQLHIYGEKVMKTFSTILAIFLVSVSLGSGEGFTASTNHTTRTDSGGGVTIKVTFVDSKTTNDLRFQVVLDTHSVNLDSYDLKAISVLRDDAGNTYASTAVENKGSGHHREAIVSFAKIAAGTKRIELVIKDVAGVKERIFRWNLE
jgi:hypothetical protein